jgi:hypothetical protein
MLLAGLMALLLAPAATAQQAEARLDPYTGVYVLPTGVQLVVSVQNDNLAVSPLGKATAKPTILAEEAYNRQADDILAGAEKNDFAALQDALASQRRDGAGDIEQLFSLFTQGYGAMTGYRVMGTMARDASRAWTLAHVTFENGQEVLRLSWKDGHLLTIQRGAYPASVYQHVNLAQFESTTGHDKITFNLRANGAVESLTMKGRHGAVTAYKLGDLAALR